MTDNTEENKDENISGDEINKAADTIAKAFRLLGDTTETLSSSLSSILSTNYAQVMACLTDVKYSYKDDCPDEYEFDERPPPLSSLESNSDLALRALDEFLYICAECGQPDLSARLRRIFMERVARLFEEDFFIYEAYDDSYRRVLRELTELYLVVSVDVMRKETRLHRHIQNGGRVWCSEDRK